MSPRKYEAEKRREAAAQTRQRILDAIVALHAERGVASTTAQQVAARADVAVATVTRYFETQDHMVEACGLHLQKILDPPGVHVLKGRRGNERLRVAIEALFAYYERGQSWFRLALRDVERVPRLALSIEYERSQQAALVRAALGKTRERFARLAIGLTRFETWDALRGAGVARNAIASTVYRLLITSLEDDS